MKTILVFLTGAAVAAATVIACSDDSPSDADAAACDCPAAEPPLAGRVAFVTGADAAMAADAFGAAFVECPTNAILLSGSCYITDDGGGTAQATLRQSGGNATLPRRWDCVWRNGPGFSATVHAGAFCLMPAQ